MAPSDQYKPPGHHQRSKSSVIKNLVHRRQPSTGEALVPEPLSATFENIADHDSKMGPGAFTKNTPLGELQQNQQEPVPRLHPRLSRDEQRDNHTRGRSHSPTKHLSNPFKSSKDASKSKTREPSPSKPKKTKSSTNLAGLLSRPKSLRNIYKLATEEEVKLEKNKENQAPDNFSMAPPPPIFSQFTSDLSVRQSPRSSFDKGSRNTSSQDLPLRGRPPIKERPKSFQVVPSPRAQQLGNFTSISALKQDEPSRKGSNPESTTGKSQRPKIFSAFSSRGHSRSKSVAAKLVAEPTPDPVLDPQDIDKHLEAMLDRRNIPENQRYKMRNLNDTIKMEFIRQDWAEMQAARTDSVNSKDNVVADVSEGEADKPKRTRGKSFTFSRGRKEERSSPKKQKGEGTLGRHFRSKSTESVISDRPSSAMSTSNSSIFSKIKLNQGPADYVAYLRKVQKPELVEVGKIHKLRLLLRNETVAWIEEFIQQGGMTEIVGLLHRIMDVEWREEHEDALLHENLLCLKALSTTGRAMQYLHSIQAELFPKLLHMLFDPEKKGPSEFTTRNIITSVLFTYIESSSPAERVLRAKSVLAHLRDPDPKEDALPFVMEMRQERPYRVWNKEVVSVTKEVFWIFLHNLNVVALPSKKPAESVILPPTPTSPTVAAEPYSYMHRNFPQERPPVPAAPYVGGVEWDATNYLASHLDLLNAILACTPTSQARNALRQQMRVSGWERAMGGSLRLCKEKFYGSVHDGLRTWVAAANEDGWDVRDVRFGLPVEAKSPKKSPVKKEEAPKIEMPKLDFGGESQKTKDDGGWIS